MKYVLYKKREISKLLVFPDSKANKYSRGYCIVVAGSHNYPGAAYLTCRASEKSGSGYTMLYTNRTNVRNLSIKLITVPVKQYSKIYDLKSFDSAKSKPMAFVIGPGFVPGSESSNKWVNFALRCVDAPVLIDGGGLSAFDSKECRFALKDRASKKNSTVLTPHLGEAVRLYNSLSPNKISAKTISEQDLCVELARLTSSIVVLKGPNTYICDSKKLYVMKQGSAALAKAGTGDVLAGIIGGIMSQGKISVFDCCVLATNIHAYAGLFAAKDLGEISVCATDVLNYIPNAFMYFC